MPQFDVNSPFLYYIAGIVIIFVIVQSIFFLVKAYKRALQLNMDKAVLRRVAFSSAVFTIAPAAAILLGVITLSKALGLPLPWLRLSVVGALTYELPAAEVAAAASGANLFSTVKDPRVFANITWVMTLGIIPGLFIMPIFMKKIQSGVIKAGGKDEKWKEIFMSALFLGMISAFLGMIFSRVREGFAGWIPVFVMLFSAVIMGILGTLRKKLDLVWLENYALPISMLTAMAFSIPLTSWIS